MKKQIVLLALTVAIMLTFSCKKTEGSTAHQTENIEETKSVTTTTEVNTKKQGFVLRVNTGLYAIDGEDKEDASTKTKWIASLSLGDSITTGKTRRMTYNNKEYDFIEVRRDAKTEGFSLVSQIAVGGVLAVVTDEKANLYKSPKTVDVTNTIVSQKTVLVYFPETEAGGFVEVKGIDCENSNAIPEGRYMRLNTLSRNDSNIQSSILLQTAQTMTNANQTIAREALLKSALQDYPDSVFFDEINNIANPSTMDSATDNENFGLEQ
ncbi:hypothetical protein [Treponema sp. R80B11-R83G3]